MAAVIYFVSYPNRIIARCHQGFSHWPNEARITMRLPFLALFGHASLKRSCLLSSAKQNNFLLSLDPSRLPAIPVTDDTPRTMTTPATASFKGLFGMTTPATENPSYAKGLFVNSSDNWWHGCTLPGTETISVRTNDDFCWSAFTNTQSKSRDMFPSLDQPVWHMVLSVGAWHPMKRA
jgi:hypothetical protein